MGKIDENAQTVHFLDHLQAEIGKPGVKTFQTALTRVIGFHIGELDDSNTQGVKDGKEIKIILDGRNILKAQNDAGFIGIFGCPDIIGRAYRDDQIGMFFKSPLPPDDIFYGLSEIFQHTHRAVNRGESPPAHSFKHGPAESGYFQTIDNDSRFVNRLAGIVHLKSLSRIIFPQ